MSACNLEYSLAGFTSACKDSLGGIKKIFITTSQSTLVATKTIGEDKSVINFTEEPAKGKWFEYRVRKATSNATSTLNVAENAGNMWSTELTMQLLKMNAANRTEVMGLSKETDLACIFVDGNGIAHFIGLDYPIEMSAGTGETGTALSDMSGFNITMKDDSLELPYVVDETFVAKIETALKA